MQYLDTISKTTECSVCFQGKPFNIAVIQVCAVDADEAEQFYEDLRDLLGLTPQKRCPFHYRGLECKSRKSRNTWSNMQIRPWNTQVSRSKANRVLPEHVLVTANTLFQQHKRRLCTRTSPDGQYWNQIDYILCSQRWRSSIQSAKTRLEADCGSVMSSLLPNSDWNVRK